MVTIYDIATKTGFTAPTVSKALNGTGKLSEATRSKILEVAGQMGYKPSMVARTLTTKKSNLIGVIYDDTKMNTGFDHPMFGGVLTRFRSQMEKAGYDIVFLSRTFQMSYLNHVRLRSVDGVAAINPDTEDNKCIAELEQEHIPCISTNDYIPGICTVVTDNEQAGYKAAEYLVNHGHRRIAFLAGPFSETSPAAKERFQGFKKYLDEQGIGFDGHLLEECPLWNMASGYQGFMRLWERTEDFTAVFAANDTLAFGIMQFAEERGIQIPQRLSLLGFDDDRVASFCRPRLTTFRQDRDTIADLAAEILLSLITGIPAPPIVRVPARLIERESVRRYP
ncbi:MAG TPA: hypothetical protein DDW78_08300 [Treponema sp.]|nr:hypothetical protein [Treponema sp.]